MLAIIAADQDGRLTDDSTLTVNGGATPIPDRGPLGGKLAPTRIFWALDAAGYKPATNYYDDLTEHDGYVTVNVVPKDAS